MVDRRVGRWLFEGSPQQVVAVTATSADFDGAIHLLSPRREEIARHSGSEGDSGSHLVSVLPMEGQYEIRVMAEAGEGGRYTVARYLSSVRRLQIGQPASGAVER